MKTLKAKNIDTYSVFIWNKLGDFPGDRQYIKDINVIGQLPCPEGQGLR
jgi:hypothetical protein